MLLLCRRLRRRRRRRRRCFRRRRRRRGEMVKRCLTLDTRDGARVSSDCLIHYLPSNQIVLCHALMIILFCRTQFKELYKLLRKAIE